jgi:hypothetical protein
MIANSLSAISPVITRPIPPQLMRPIHRLILASLATASRRVGNVVVAFGLLISNPHLSSAIDDLPTSTLTATPCAGLVLSENFDRVTAPALPAGWVATTVVGAGLWATSNNSPDTKPNCAFAYTGNDTLSDKRLDTPTIAISTTGAHVSFRHQFRPGSRQEAGGVLEISSPNINGGAFTDITDAAVGGSFVTGGYNRLLFGSTPLGRRMAWAWTLPPYSYIDTVTNLGPHVAGQTIQLRFRVGGGWISGFTAASWRVDTVRVVDGPCLSTH